MNLIDRFHKRFDWLYLGMTANLRLDERDKFKKWWDKVGVYMCERVELIKIK